LSSREDNCSIEAFKCSGDYEGIVGIPASPGAGIQVGVCAGIEVAV